MNVKSWAVMGYANIRETSLQQEQVRFKLGKAKTMWLRAKLQRLSICEHVANLPYGWKL